MTTLKCKETIFSNIDAIIFDKDGTLADSQQFWREMGQRRARIIDAKIPGVGEPLLMAFGIDNGKLNPQGLMAVGTRHENEIAAAAYIAETGRSWFESLEIARQGFIDAERNLKGLDSTSPLFSGCETVIDRYVAAGLRLGILSSDTTMNIQNFVAQHGLKSQFQLCMGADQGLVKPDPVMFLKACEKLGVNPEKTLMIGDTVGDMMMAKRAGAGGTIGMCWGSQKEVCLDGADVAIAGLDALQII